MKPSPGYSGDTSRDKLGSARSVASLFRPTAVTLVGASPKSHVTRVLLKNFTRDDCPFRGPINLVNPNQAEVLGRPTVPTLEQVDGDLGLVYLLVSTDVSLAVLEEAIAKGLSPRIAGIVVYAAGFGEAGAADKQAAMVAACHRLGVPILGPQSTGLISRWAGLLGITDPVPETFVEGRVGVIAQSTGLLGGAASWLFRRGVGLAAGVGFGNGAAISYAELAGHLLSEPDVDVVCVYADAVGTLDELVSLGELAQRSGKPTVLLSGASAPIAQRAARSHTGMLATPSRIIRGVAEQYGLLLVDDFEQLLWAGELFVHPQVRRVVNPGVGVFTASGGGGIIAAEAIEKAGLALREPSEETRSALGLSASQLANPFDIGAISLDRPEDYDAKLRSFASDDHYGVIVRPSSLGAPSERLADHRRSLVSFVETVVLVDKLPVVAFPYQEDQREYHDVVTWPEVLVVGGSSELQTKLTLLNSWLGGANPVGLEPVVEAPVETEVPENRSVIADLATTRKVLNSAYLTWPRGVAVSNPSSLQSSLDALGWKGERLVAKTSLALPHRAIAGGVLLGLSNVDEVAAAVQLLYARFEQPVLLEEEIPFTSSYFIGMQSSQGKLLLAFGAGTANDSSEVATRLCPLDRDVAARLVAETCQGARVHPPDELEELLVELSERMAGRADVDVVDVNPLVVDSRGRLVVLDAKVYLNENAVVEGTGEGQ